MVHTMSFCLGSYLCMQKAEINEGREDQSEQKKLKSTAQHDCFCEQRAHEVSDTLGTSGGRRKSLFFFAFPLPPFREFGFGFTADAPPDTKPLFLSRLGTST